MSASTDTKAQIAQAIDAVMDEVPALRQLKLVFTLELRGRGDIQQFRVELPGPKISKDVGGDSRVTVEMRREFFNAMVGEGARVADWREAFQYGQAKASGVSQILKLIERVVSMQEERAALRRARPR
jgi:hypothetical protein